MSHLNNLTELKKIIKSRPLIITGRYYELKDYLSPLSQRCMEQIKKERLTYSSCSIKLNFLNNLERDIAALIVYLLNPEESIDINLIDKLDSQLTRQVINDTNICRRN